MMSTSLIFDHLWISLLPLLAGSILGGCAGYMLAKVLQGVYEKYPTWESAAMLLPWRTGLAIGILTLVVSPVVVINVGLGNKAGILILGSVATALAIPYTCSIYLKQRRTSSIYSDLTAGARSLAVLLATGAVFVYWVGGGGAGGLIFPGLRDIISGQLSEGIYIVAIIALGYDVVLGGIQFALTTK
jgi:hypothetical protein